MWAYFVVATSAGTLGAALIFAIYLFANYFETAAPELYGVPAWQIALPIHVVAWILQVRPQRDGACAALKDM